MAKNNLNIWVIVLIVIVVAVAATLITVKMTGNVISVSPATTAQKVYTATEVDKNLESALVDTLKLFQDRCTIITYAGWRNISITGQQSLSCKDVCTKYGGKYKDLCIGGFLENSKIIVSKVGNSTIVSPTQDSIYPESCNEIQNVGTDLTAKFSVGLYCNCCDY